MKKLFAVTLLAVTLVSLTGCAGPAPYTKFQDAEASCAASSGVSVLDDGTTLTVDMMGEDELSGATYDDVSCIVDEVGTPSYVKDEMWATRAIDGRQSEVFEDVTVKWSYSPGSGMQITYHKTK